MLCQQIQPFTNDLLEYFLLYPISILLLIYYETHISPSGNPTFSYSKIS